MCSKKPLKLNTFPILGSPKEVTLIIFILIKTVIY